MLSFQWYIAYGTGKFKVKIRTFSQEPFEANGRKVSDLLEEPSASSLDLDLDLGTLVVKTKKLRKTSKLNIHSALGTAGIRGTEFQLSQTPEAGIQLDVTESTVAFTPPGGQPTAVTQGQGLDVSNAGQIAPRPVNPVAAQNITATNEAATQVSSEISLEVVSEAMVETEAETTTNLNQRMLRRLGKNHRKILPINRKRVTMSRPKSKVRSKARNQLQQSLHRSKILLLPSVPKFEWMKSLSKIRTPNR